MSFTTSPETDKLDAALARVLADLAPAAKDKTNPAFRTRYADLTAVWDAARPALAAHSVSVTQWPLHSEDGRLHLLTRLAHAGQWMSAELSIPVPKSDPQGYGSAMTYARRYALSAALGVVADEDDDGAAASAPAPKRAPKPRPEPEPNEPTIHDITGGKASIDQVELLSKLVRSHVFTDTEREKVMGKIAGGLSKAAATKLIERTMDTIKRRKADEADAREEAGA